MWEINCVRTQNKTLHSPDTCHRCTCPDSLVYSASRLELLGPVGLQWAPPVLEVRQQDGRGKSVHRARCRLGAPSISVPLLHMVHHCMPRTAVPETPLTPGMAATRTTVTHFFNILIRSSRQIFIRVGRTNSSYLTEGSRENDHVLDCTRYPQNKLSNG
jgi:hypothetical protein